MSGSASFQSVRKSLYAASARTRAAAASAPLRGSRLQGVGTSHSQRRQCSRPAVPHNPAVVENLLKLGGGGQRLQRRRHGLSPAGRAQCEREQRAHPRRLAYTSDFSQWVALVNQAEERGDDPIDDGLGFGVVLAATRAGFCSKWFGWQSSFEDVYVSNPPTATKKNDLQIAAGLNCSFTHY
jgi:hypothetical protein